ncbi:MAG: radical SAM protein [bacterium]|nr:radical SAM protein [bacterium]
MSMDKNQEILLLLLPFWTALVPPPGISCLKGYLEPHGYRVKTVDANTELCFRELHDRYFQELANCVPAGKQGNFKNIGNYVLQSHMMAHFNREDENAYLQLVKILIDKTFFCSPATDDIRRLNLVLDDYYHRLETYLTELLETVKPSVLGISAFSCTLPSSMFAFHTAKEKYPHLKTIMGGGVFADQLAPGSPNYRLFLEKTSYIDKMIIGEGELLFHKYLRGELPEQQRVFTLQDIDCETLDLSRAVVPDFSDFNLDNYTCPITYVSRSCPFQCNFCSETMQWGKYRKKKAEQIVGELRELRRKYHRQLYLMGDSLLNPVADDLSRELSEAGESIYWDGYLRADKHVCNRENTLRWRKGGFYRARLGLESGSQRVLDLMSKKTTTQQNRDAVSSLAAAGIKTTTYWVIGYPGETEEDFQNTLDLIELLKNDIYEAECNPFNYFLSGQVKSDGWDEEKKILLYPENAKDMLVAQTWIVDEKPCREDIYKRVNRFVRHCRQLGIPNPYSARDIYLADERWKKLHKNAVPPLAKFADQQNCIDENKYVKQFFEARTIPVEDGDFSLD